MIIYGLHTCAISQNARKALEAAGKDVVFRDVRDQPLSEAELAGWWIARRMTGGR